MLLIQTSIVEVLDLGCRVSALGAWDLGFRLQGFGLMVLIGVVIVINAGNVFRAVQQFNLINDDCGYYHDRHRCYIIFRNRRYC